ncbi:MAG: helix-turn-helix transcriptional regulator [Deltaproteobacteria bacterium]|nr:helix-turn-helix transcriptional regulator [Deltaproteobacteria bacterium]
MTTKNKKMSGARKLLASLHRRPMSFGRMIESCRKCDGITQADLAHQLKISSAHLCDIEKGRRAVSPERAAQFAKVLGYSVNQFIARSIEDNLKRMGIKLKVDLSAA